MFGNAASWKTLMAGTRLRYGSAGLSVLGRRSLGEDGKPGHRR
jgi:hypothetical protein